MRLLELKKDKLALRYSPSTHLPIEQPTHLVRLFFFYTQILINVTP